MNSSGISRWNLISGVTVAWMTVVSSRVNAQETAPDPGRWAYPQQAVVQSDPQLIGDYVPCIFELDEQGNFRAYQYQGPGL